MSAGHLRYDAWVYEVADLITENAALRERIAAAIEAEADQARASYKGRRADALRYAAEIARSTP